MRKLLGAVAVALPAVSVAQWAQEPATVMGIELGAQKETIPACPPGSAALQSKTTCREDSRFEPSAGVLWGLPLNFNLGGDVAYVNGRIAQVTMSVRHDESYGRLKSILIERYGPPHKTGVQQVTANSGAVLTAEETTWQGPKVQILLLERADRLDRSKVLFSYRPLAQPKAQQDGHGVRRDAAKL